MKKIIFFDLDGTLGDTLPLCIKAFKNAVEPILGNTLSEEQIVSSFGPSEEGAIRALLPNQYKAAIEGYLDWYESLHHMCPEPFEGIPELLELLKSHSIKIALVTGKGKRSCFITLNYYGIADYFDVIKTGSFFGAVKTENIKEVLQEYNFAEDEAIYIGDAPSDIYYARKAGVSAFSVLWGSVVDEAGVKKNSPNMIFYTVEELRSYLIMLFELEI